MQENCFYVYEWFNKNTDEVFYVGKGKNKRYKDVKSRNKYFLNYYSKHKNDCDVRFVTKNVSESEAFDIEVSLIEKNKSIGQCKCNLTVGGEGATFPEYSWNHWFRKLQYMHDVKGAMDKMPNESDYRVENLKKKSTEELMDMYNSFINYQDMIRDAKEFGSLREIDLFEMKITSSEITMLTKMIAKTISDKNIKFKKYIECKTELDFMLSEINWNDFLNEMAEDYNYMFEVYRAIDTAIKFMIRYKQISNIKIKSGNIKDEVLNIRFYTSDSNTTRMVNIDILNIIFGILIDEYDLLQIINKEIFSAPFVV